MVLSGWVLSCANLACEFYWSNFMVSEIRRFLFSGVSRVHSRVANLASFFFSKKTRHKKYQQNLKFFSLWYGAVWVGTQVCKSGLRVLLVKFYGFRDKAFFVFRGFPGTLKGCKSGLNFFSK